MLGIIFVQKNIHYQLLKDITNEYSKIGTVPKIHLHNFLSHMADTVTSHPRCVTRYLTKLRNVQKDYIFPSMFAIRNITYRENCTAQRAYQ